MTIEQIQNEIEKIDQQIQDLNEHRCEGLVCTTNEHEKTLQLQELIEKRTELYYQLNIKKDLSSSTKQNNLQSNPFDQEKLEIAKNLLDILDDETISIKVGVGIEEVRKLRTE